MSMRATETIDIQAAVTLGSSCALAYHLHRKQLCLGTGPLDWGGSRHWEGVRCLLEREFRGLMARRHIEVRGIHDQHYDVWDCEHEIRSLHDFPVDGAVQYPRRPVDTGERIRRVGDRIACFFYRRAAAFSFPAADGGRIQLAGFPAFRRRIRRRVARIQRVSTLPGLVLVSRVLGDGDDAEDVDRAVRKWRGNRPTRLLLLERSGGEAGGFGGSDIVVHRLPSEDLSLPHDQWRGDDEEWDHLLARYRRHPQAPHS
jgi:hypothetical protein